MDTVDPAIVALALGAVFFVNVLTDVVKKIIGRHRTRRWLLPLSGMVIGMAFVGLLQVYRQVELTGSAVALTMLAGVMAFALAAAKNDQGKSAEQAGGKG
jgi:heme A synthase